MKGAGKIMVVYSKVGKVIQAEPPEHFRRKYPGDFLYTLPQPTRSNFWIKEKGQQKQCPGKDETQHHTGQAAL